MLHLSIKFLIMTVSQSHSFLIKWVHLLAVQNKDCQVIDSWTAMSFLGEAPMCFIYSSAPCEPMIPPTDLSAVKAWQHHCRSTDTTHHREPEVVRHAPCFAANNVTLDTLQTVKMRIDFLLLHMIYICTASWAQLWKLHLSASTFQCDDTIC